MEAPAHPNHYTRADVRRAVALYVRRRMSAQAVAAHLGIAMSTAVKWLRREGVLRSRQEANRALHDHLPSPARCRRAIEQTGSAEAAARLLGICSYTLRRRARRAGACVPTVSEGRRAAHDARWKKGAAPLLRLRRAIDIRTAPRGGRFAPWRVVAAQMGEPCGDTLRGFVERNCARLGYDWQALRGARRTQAEAVRARVASGEEA